MSSRSILKKLKQVDDTKDEADADGLLSDFDSVDKLQELGINVSDIKKLKLAGVMTVGLVGKTARKTLLAIKGFSEAKVDKIIDLAGKLEVATGSGAFITGVEALELRKSVVKVTTGATALDELLGGGIETRQITEVCGEYRTGKTQLCHTLCVTSQLPSAIRPTRIISIAERWNLDPAAVLDNISIARVFTTAQQIGLIHQVAERLVEDEDRYRVLIIDSVMSIFRSEFQGRGELAERQQTLGRHLNHLTKIAEEFNIAVFLVNQVCSDPSGGMTYVSDPKKAIGGHIMAHACTTRLMLRKGSGNTRICKLYDSPNLPESEATFMLSNEGVRDVDD